MWDTTSVITILGSCFYLGHVSNFFNNDKKFGQQLKSLFIGVSIWLLVLLFSMNGQILTVNNGDSSLDNIYTLNLVGLYITLGLSLFYTALFLINLAIMAINKIGKRK